MSWTVSRYARCPQHPRHGRGAPVRHLLVQGGLQHALAQLLEQSAVAQQIDALGSGPLGKGRDGVLVEDPGDVRSSMSSAGVAVWSLMMPFVTVVIINILCPRFHRLPYTLPPVAAATVPSAPTVSACLRLRRNPGAKRDTSPTISIYAFPNDIQITVRPLLGTATAHTSD